MPSTLRLPKPIAATGTTTIHREVIGDEYVQALADLSNRMAFYTRMRASDGAVNTSLLAVEKPILGAAWEISGDDEIAEAVREELFETPHGDAWDKPLIEQALAHLLGYLQYGFSAAEPFWEHIPEDGRIHCTRLTLIRQESVRTFRLNNGRLEALIQYASDLSGSLVDITVPIERLLFIVLGRRGSDYSGTSLIRSSYRAWMERDVIRKTRLWHHDRFGAGTPVANYPENAGDDDKSAIDAALQTFRAGSRSFMAFPHGTEFQLFGGATSSNDPTAELASLAAEIAKNTLSQVTEFGTQGNTGNRSLGESANHVLLTALQGIAEDVAAIVQRGLIRPFVQWNFGDRAEVPMLAVRVSLAGVEEMLANLEKAKSIGVALQPEDELAVRDELELPSLDIDELKKRRAEQQAAKVEESAAKAPVRIVAADPKPEVRQLEEPSGDLIADYLGRLRPRVLVELEDRVLRPKLLADTLDTETSRATGDIVETLRQIDEALVVSIRALAARGGTALIDGITDVAVPGRLRVVMRAALKRITDRVREIGHAAVRNELARQGLDAQATRESGSAGSLIARVIAPLIPGGGRALTLELPDALTAFAELSLIREISQREQAAQQAALAEVARQATTGAFSPDLLAQRVKDSIEERSVRQINDRIGQVVNSAFGVGRTEEAARFERYIERQIRSEALDVNTCDHCARHDGDDFPFGDERAPSLPDAECDGQYRCRGVWIYELASEGS